MSLVNFKKGNKWGKCGAALMLALLCFSCEKDPVPSAYTWHDGKLEDGYIIYNAATDYDGNSYDAVRIGEQVWMMENLRTTHYADGTSIDHGTGTSTTKGYWYYPDDDANNMEQYGLLYNWKAVMRNSSSSNSNPSGVQGICPNGWHVPSDAEWKQMEMAAGMSQSDANSFDYRGNIAAKLCGNTGWFPSSNANAAGNLYAPDRNSTGFGALPAGGYGSSYDYFGDYALFWSATENSSDYAYGRGLYYANAGVGCGYDDKSYGFSVRCVRDESVAPGSATLPTVTTSAVSNIAASTATCGGNVTADGGASVTSRGVCWSTSHNPTVSNSHTTNGTGKGGYVSNITGLSTNTTYYVRAYATNSEGTSYGEERTFTTYPNDGQPCSGSATVIDYDGNVYNTVHIGTQCWMKNNLRTTHYADGTAIPLGSSSSVTTAYRYCPDNNNGNVTTFGYLYNWMAVIGGSTPSNAVPSGTQGICPDGWHLPSDAEWTQLTDYLSSDERYYCYIYNNRIGKALAAHSHWTGGTEYCDVGYDLGSNNATGFSALPAGYYEGNDWYYDFGEWVAFWSCTETSGTTVYVRSLWGGSGKVERDSRYKTRGHSVRCVRN